MTDQLVFMMGEYEAHFPTNLRYGKNHMWAAVDGDHVRFGLSAYAVRLLQDVYFLDMTLESGMQIQQRHEIGSIESKKAESSLYSPIAGTVTQINELLLEDPTPINTDKYGAGWLFELVADPNELFDAKGYMVNLESAWEIAQRMIKGQANA